jgi:hypothetical protein
MVSNFCPKVRFSPDESGCCGEGEMMLFVVLRFVKSDQKISNVSASG